MTPEDPPAPARRVASWPAGLVPWHGIGRQLAHPSGAMGRLAGRFMVHVNRRPYDLALDALDPGPGDEVLEIGFGPGEGLAALVRRVPRGRIFGLDGSPQMVRRAARRNRRALADGRLTLAGGDFRRLPWGDACFDGVLAVNVAYFFDAEGRAARELARVLRPAGRAVLNVTDRKTMRSWRFAGPDTHVTYDAAALRMLLERGGFAPDSIEIRKVELAMKVKGLVAIARRGPP